MFKWFNPETVAWLVSLMVAGVNCLNSWNVSNIIKTLAMFQTDGYPAGATFD